MRVLGVETSCDETAVAIYDATAGLLAHQLYSQIAMHAQYGGVVPELASRDHIRKLQPLVKEAMHSADCKPADIDAIAYTAGPGLLGALLVGAVFARTLAWAWQKPSIAIHHLEAHLLAPMLEEPAPEAPFMALLVSGGHTQLIYVEKIGSYQLLGDTLDDAVGEAFDKTAKLLGLPYPGGAALAALAQSGDPQRYHFPRPMVDRPGLDFSFSGLKTFALNTWQKDKDDPQCRADIARAFEDAVVETLLIKCRRAMQQTQAERLVVAGGVGANLSLRKALSHLAKQQGFSVFYPRFEFCTDNGAMVAYAGYQRLLLGAVDTEPLTVRARWPLS